MSKNSMLISSGSNQFLLTNLRDKQIDEFTNAKLSKYFVECITTGSNICSVEDSESVDTSSRAPANGSQMSSRTLALTSSRAPANGSQTSSRAPAHATSFDTSPHAKKAKRSGKLSEEEQCLFDEILVTQVMAQPMLYNPRLKSHRFAGTNAEKWKIIGDLENFDLKEAPTVQSCCSIYCLHTYNRTHKDN